MLGDYLKVVTDKQLNLLSASVKNIDKSVRFIIKPHPGCPINMKDFSNLNGKISTKPIQELMKVSDIVYSNLVTSAVIDASCAGLPVISFLDGKTLNNSPLRGSNGVYFVESSRELANAINTIEVSNLGKKEDYFHLDPSLPRWQTWLNNNASKN